MPEINEEISSQPDCWETAIARSPEFDPLLPAPGARTAVVGCGTSFNVALAYAALRERAGRGETDAFAASQLPGRRYDHYVLISRSGTTTEVLRVAQRLRGTAPVVAVCADAGTPIGRASDAVVALPWAAEDAVVQTRFATTALVVLAQHAGLPMDDLVAAGRAACTAELPAGALAAQQWTFLGDGWTVGLAHEAALKLREAALAWTESYPAMEYRHGPISISDERSHVWLLGEAPAGLPEEIRRTGATVTVGHPQPIAELLRIHRLAVEVARGRGLDPNRPRHLTASVVLPGEG